MALYSEETIRRLKEATDISLVIEQFIPLKRTGGGKYLGLCPFHDDSSPSMTVTPSIGIYKCFACGAGGDVFKFVMEHEKLDFRAAIEFVAGIVGFSLPVLNNEQDENASEKDLIIKINELAGSWFKEQLLKHDFAKKYLEQREISSKTIDIFKLGYSPRSGFLEIAGKAGFKPEFIVKAGLAQEKDGKVLDKFRDRLMIPICSLSGIVVGFGGRDLSGNSRAKYMNSPETLVYNKSEILFGLCQSRKAISKENSVILVEGYFDVISLYQSGIENVVAISGIALSEIQAKLLLRYTKNAFICLDGDNAGQAATERCIEVLLSQSFSVKVVNLTNKSGEKTDPDSYIKEHSVEDFKNLLHSSKNWLNYLSDKTSLNSVEDKAAFVLRIKTLIASMNNIELKKQYLNLLNERFNVSKTLPVLRAKKIQIQDKEDENNIEASPKNTTEIPLESLPSDEIWLVDVIFKNEDIQAAAIKICDPSMLSSTWLAELLDYGYALYEETGKIDLKILYDKLPPIHRELLSYLPEKPWTKESAIMDFSAAVIKLRISDLKTKLKESRDNFELYKEILEKIKNYESLAKRAKNGENLLDYLGVI